MSKKEHVPSTISLLILGSISLLNKDDCGVLFPHLVRKKAGLLSGSFYPALKMLKDRKMVSSAIEDGDLSAEYGGPILTSLRLTKKGERFVEEFGLEKLVGVVPFCKY